MEFYFDAIAFSKQTILLTSRLTGVCKIFFTKHRNDLINSVVCIRNPPHMVRICYISTK